MMMAISKLKRMKLPMTMRRMKYTAASVLE